MYRCRGKHLRKKNENEIFIKKKIFKTCYIGVGVDKDKE
jgi:hypothetical protein